MVVGVIFDIDGTLVTFEFDVRGTRKALIGELEREGFDATGLDLSTPTQYILDSARRQSLAGGPAYEVLRKNVFAILDEFEAESARTTAPIPGVRGTLDELRSRGARLGVLTNSGRRAAEQAVRKAGLQDCFEFILTRDDTEIMKPRPEGVEMAAARFNLPKGLVYYVGDSLFDVQAARGAGVRAVSVATGNFSLERLKGEHPDFAISRLAGLGAVLGV
jgi:phosphoglycolate phosphatase